jgi:hypothetical protein
MERLHLGYEEAYSLPVMDASWLLENLWELDKARGEVDQSAR